MSKVLLKESTTLGAYDCQQYEHQIARCNHHPRRNVLHSLFHRRFWCSISPLSRMRTLHYRVKNWLFRESWRKLRIIALLYQIQFGRTNWSKKNHLVHLLRFLIKIVKRIATFVKIAILFWKRYCVLIECTPLNKRGCTFSATGVHFSY